MKVVEEVTHKVGMVVKEVGAIRVGAGMEAADIKEEEDIVKVSGVACCYMCD